MRERIPVSEAYNMDCMEYMRTLPDKAFDLAVVDPPYAWIFARYARPGDRILDTYLGSGSSRIAAWDAGLDFVGCEIDRDYFGAQEQRFAAHTAQLNLFLGEGG